MLATVYISSAKDDQGKVINFTPEFTAGLGRYLVSRWVLPSSLYSQLFYFSHPVKFPCSISARSHMHSGRVDTLRAAM
jgi:hypothetical protein